MTLISDEIWLHFVEHTYNELLLLLCSVRDFYLFFFWLVKTFYEIYIVYGC